MMASPGVMLQPCHLLGEAGFLSHHCPCNKTMPSCYWQIAAGTHFLETRCLRAFSQQTLLCGHWWGSGTSLVLSPALLLPQAHCPLP